MKNTLKYLSLGILLLLLVSYILGRFGAGDKTDKDAQYIEIKGELLRYIEKGSGPDVLLIHGTPGSIEDMQPLMDLLAKDHRVVAYDRPGHGYSTANDIPRNVEHNTQTAFDMLEAFKMDSATVVGHSYGGIVAMDMAIKGSDRVEDIVIIGSPLFTFEMENIYKLFKIPVLKTCLSWMVSGAYAGGKIENDLPQRFGTSHTLDMDEIVAFRKDLWTQPKVILSKSIETANMQDEFDRMVPQYKNLKEDVLILMGDQDVAYYTRDIKTNMPIPRVEVKYYKDNGHFLQLEAPQQVTNDILHAESN